MKGSLNLGKILGIRVLIHWTFLILIAWIVFVEIQKGNNLTQILITLGFVLTIFITVVLHEFGHALMARRFHIDTRKITLLPIGGVASLERMPEEPKKELLVALAGPMVNIVIALILAVFVDFEQWSDPSQFENLTQINGSNFLFMLFSVNVILVLFNAIPAFPMDGGRVLRALLALKMDRVKATRIASGLGRVVAVGFFFIGLLYSPILLLIGIFVFFGAYSENTMVQHLELLRGYSVEDAMMTRFASLEQNNRLKDAVDIILDGSENDIIILDQQQVVGVLSKNSLINGLKQHSLDTPVSLVMDQGFHSFSIRHKLTDVYTEAQKRKKRFFPVLNEKKLVGAINMENINEFIMIQASLNY
jgi:Zn-dependent protease